MGVAMDLTRRDRREHSVSDVCGKRCLPSNLTTRGSGCQASDFRWQYQPEPTGSAPRARKGIAGFGARIWRKDRRLPALTRGVYPSIFSRLHAARRENCAAISCCLKESRFCRCIIRPSRLCPAELQPIFLLDWRNQWKTWTYFFGWRGS